MPNIDRGKGGRHLKSENVYGTAIKAIILLSQRNVSMILDLLCVVPGSTHNLDVLLCTLSRSNNIDVSPARFFIF